MPKQKEVNKVVCSMCNREQDKGNGICVECGEPLAKPTRTVQTY